MRRWWLALTACVLLGCSGCVSGLLYTHTIEPLSTDFDRTPVGETTAVGDVRQLRYSSFEVQWSSNAIGEIARRHGMQQVYYADLETLSVLGVWTQRWVLVYGR